MGNPSEGQAKIRVWLTWDNINGDFDCEITGMDPADVSVSIVDRETGEFYYGNDAADPDPFGYDAETDVEAYRHADGTSCANPECPDVRAANPAFPNSQCPACGDGLDDGGRCTNGTCSNQGHVMNAEVPA